MAYARVEGSEVERAVETSLESCDAAVLAVSGGLDSMAMLTAASRLPARARRKITVATFDHGTGKAAGRAAALVSRHAFRAGFLCVSGRASTVGTREAEWRQGRWQFLQQVASARGANVVTAHTLDDQVETVFMRILREAGPPGLAGYDADCLRVLWPALAARASVVMDRRGTQRGAEFTIRGSTGGAIQLSGGVEIVMRRDHMLLRRVPAGGRVDAREVRA